MVLSRVIIRVTPFRAFITLLITYLLSPLPLQVGPGFAGFGFTVREARVHDLRGFQVAIRNLGNFLISLYGSYRPLHKYFSEPQDSNSGFEGLIGKGLETRGLRVLGFKGCVT